jgi:hypothetical protein
LVERELLFGEISRRWKKSSNAIKDWHVHSLKFAAQVGFRPTTVLQSTINHVAALLEIKGACDDAAKLAVPANVCCCVENPTAMMEKQIYMQVGLCLCGLWCALW